MRLPRSLESLMQYKKPGETKMSNCTGEGTARGHHQERMVDLRHGDCPIIQTWGLSYNQKSAVEY